MEPPKKYKTIREAAVEYRVSRSKVHRLVKKGVVRTTRDPRDQRATMVDMDDLSKVFGERDDSTMIRYDATDTGRLTVERMAEMDTIRERIAAEYGVASDSTEIIREEREKRSRYLDEVSRGIYDAGERSS